MKLPKVLMFIIVAFLPFLVHGGRKSRWGCSSNSDCALACHRSCSSSPRPFCYSRLCYCQALDQVLGQPVGQAMGQAMGQVVGYPRAGNRRAMGPPDTDELFDYDLGRINYDIKQI